MHLAVLGMGRMGRALAGRLLDNGHELTVWNRSPGKAGELLDRGAREARSVRSALEGAEIAITSLANDDVVQAVALGEDGIRSALPDTTVYVDASTVAPATTATLADAFPRFAAMPILGPPPQVTSGEAIYLTGASGDAAEAVDRLFPALAERRIAYERPALASAAKITVNLLLLDGVVALAEAFAGGRAGGLSDDQLRELLGESPMVAPGVRSRFEGILTGEQETLWTVGLGAKDARLAVELAGADPLPVTARVQERYEEAASRFGEVDIAAVARLYRR